jgi:hypothetical protein
MAIPSPRSALLLLAAAALAAACRPAPPPPPPSPVEEQVASWRAGKRVAAGAAPADAERHLALGAAALASDDPGRLEEAIRLFREAIAADPARVEAVAGYATAVASRLESDPDADAGELRVAHALLDHARAAAPERADVLAASARLLLAVPSAANDAEALAAAGRAQLLAPDDPAARLAHGLARGRTDPAAAAVILEEGLRVPPDPRLLSAAARARWAAGDASRALALVERRLAADPGASTALALRAEIEAAAGRIADARATLSRLAGPAGLPQLLLARLAYQHEGDLPRARRLLEDALSRAPGPFVAARALAHRAAVERAGGDAAAAARSVEDALARVPGSAPARFQEALLAFDRGDVAALRRAAGVVGERAGPLAARLLAARALSLSGETGEAALAYRAAADEASRDPRLLLGISGLLARAGAAGAALDVARDALGLDLADGRLARPPTEFWEGPSALGAAAQAFATLARSEPRTAADALSAAAACELLLGRTAPAERLARAASGASPQLAYPLAILAQIALDRGEPRRALPLARAAAARAGRRDAFARAVLARALEAAGRPDQADDALREALASSPGLVAARLAFARSLARRGAAAEAASLLEGLLAEDRDLADARGALLALRAPP